MLRRAGAEVIELPLLEDRPPRDFRSLDEALERIEAFDWVVFSGTRCVENTFDRRDLGGLGASGGPRVGAIGSGAVGALRRRGVQPGVVPSWHRAEEVAEALGDVEGLSVLLVRVEGASPALPDALVERGAEVTEVVGYRMEVVADPDEMRRAFEHPFDAIALANPSSARYLVEGLEQAGLMLEHATRGALIAVAGPATAEMTRAHGLEPGLVAAGRLRHLAGDLSRRFNLVK
jgi:uroporphyrinogen III methyltransferase/synthase